MESYNVVWDEDRKVYSVRHSSLDFQAEVISGKLRILKNWPEKYMVVRVANFPGYSQATHALADRTPLLWKELPRE